jgi:hypothetical protein
MPSKRVAFIVSELMCCSKKEQAKFECKVVVSEGFWVLAVTVDVGY